MAELIDGFHVFSRFRAVVKAIDTIYIDEISLSATHQNLTANGRAKAMTHKDNSPCMLFIQHRIDGFGEEVERVLHVWLAALAIAWQVDE